MSSQFAVAVRNAMADAAETAMGSAPTLRIRTGPRPANCAAARQGAILGQITLSANWLADAVNGVKTGAAIPEFSAIASGEAGHFEFMQGSDCVWQGSVGLAGSGASMILGALDIDTNQLIRVSLLTLTIGGE